MKPGRPLEQPKYIEPISEGMLASLFKCMTPLQRAAITLHGEIDTEVGRGVFEETTHCVWTTQGKRLIIALTSDMGLMLFCPDKVDPLYKELKKKKK